MSPREKQNSKYHDMDITSSKFLITGGAGFIGSNLVEYLLRHNAGHVRVLDNLSNGYFENIQEFIKLKNFEFIEGDIRDFETCKIAVAGVDYISHQAALGSVPRSIKNPRLTNEVNVSGFLNMLVAANEETGVKKMIYAASSSTYGDSKALPKQEDVIGKPLSPYAVTKLVNELYADVFSQVYGFHTIGLRYFNVFGPKQNPLNPYAAVIPLFIKSASERTRPRIFGDGTTSRDFTFIENVIEANIRSLFTPLPVEKHMVFNIAYGEKTSLNDLWSIIAGKFNATEITPEYLPERVGDIKESLADISKAKDILGYSPAYSISEGIEELVRYQNAK